MTGVTQEIANARHANDRQVGGDHYKTGGTELWDLFGPESIIFYAVRYVQRWRKKDGVKDLEKALHCVQKLREIAPRFVMRNMLAVDDGLFEAWMCNAVDGADERTVIRRLVIWWKDDVELEYAQRQIEYLIRKESQVKASTNTKRLEEIVEESRNYLLNRDKCVVITNAPLASERRVPRHEGLGAIYDAGRLVAGDTSSCGDGLFDDHARYAAARDAAFSHAPWVVDEDWLAKSEIGTDLIDRYWTKRAPHVYVLDPYVKCDNIPRTLRHVYNLLGDGNWTLDVRKCPPDAREYFPSLPLSQNMREWGERAEWQRVLYAWDEMESKYKLGKYTGAWHVDDEEYTE